MSDVDALLNDVIAGIDKAGAQRMQLAAEIDAVKAAKQQVTESEDKSLKGLEQHFSRVRAELTALLQGREESLRREIRQIQTDAMAPLDTCEKSLDDSLKACASLMEQGKQLLMGDHEQSKGAMLEFKDRVHRTKFDNISWAPSLPDVQCIHVDLPTGLVPEVSGMLEDYGTVFARAPVQITGVQEMPGSLRVQWHEIEEESDLDLSNFRLQFCEVTDEGDGEPTFKDAYQGKSQCAVVRRLDVNRRYSFRVSGKAEEGEAWSPWSVAVNGCTMLPPYEWSSENRNGYALSSEGRLACKQCDDNSIIMSEGACFTCGHSLHFQILCDATCSDKDGFFLTVTRDIQEPWQHKGTLFVSSQGTIFLDGEQKTTKLDKFTKNSSLTFNTEVLETNKIRTSIEMNNKYSVTFDWLLSNIGGGESVASQSMVGGLIGLSGNPVESINLYYGAKFTCPGWKFSVE